MDTTCYNELGIPLPCGGWGIANSYVTDPIYAGYLTLAWTSFIAFAFFTTIPTIYSFFISGRWREQTLLGYFGLSEGSSSGYNQLDVLPKVTKISNFRIKTPKILLAPLPILQKISRTTLSLPNLLNRLPYFRSQSCHERKLFLPFSIGSLFLVLLIPAFILSTLFPESTLVLNPNRFGFLALACIPPIFILSSKSSPIVWLTGQGWTAINFLHRWTGRAIVILVFLHAYFWTMQSVQSNQLVEFFGAPKQILGITAFGFLSLIGLSSVRAVRNYSYPVFFTLHYVGIIGFLVFINQHTPYANGWATYAVVGIYGFDIVGRLSGLRIRYVEVEAIDGEMVRIGMPGITSGWKAGQHISLRLFFSPPSPSVWSTFRLFESHPFSIASAPTCASILNSLSHSEAPVGVELFIKSCGKGSWTGDLLATAQLATELDDLKPEFDQGGKRMKKTLHMFALVEGPYGGLGPFVTFEQENILLVAGGSGMSHVLGLLDEIVARKLITGGKVSVVWAIKERAHIDWFSNRLETILRATEGSPLTISLRIYITCDPLLTTISPIPSSNLSSSVPEISLPKTQLIHSRPILSQLMTEVVDAALAPCGRCWPVCYCGEINKDGICGNDEEECCTGPDDARDLLEKGEFKDDQEKLMEDLPSCCGKEISEIPVEILSKTKESCCGSSILPIDRKDIGSSNVSCGGCCAQSGSNCCSGGTEGELEKKLAGPIRVRTGGLGVIVCGPSSMISELRAAVANVPIAKQIRIGGIDWHEEGYSV